MPGRSIEATGMDVDEAIESGLAALGVARSEVEIEVLDRGSRGLLGLGTREARVRLTMKERWPAAQRPADPVDPDIFTSEEGPGIDLDLPRQEPMPDAVEDHVIADDEVDLDDMAEPGFADLESTESEEYPRIDLGDHERDVEVALDKLRGILERLDFEDAETAVVLSDPDPRTGRQVPIIQLSGDGDLGLLVGSGGTTLRDLQYLIRLMVGHELHQRSNIIIDISGYRDQRQQALTKLAERMAHKAMERGRPVTLEPMPPNERRIIHLALHDHDKVYTESAGDGEQRRVRIYLKKQSGVSEAD